MLIFEFIIWLCIFMLFWTFIGYPLTIWLLSRLFPRSWSKQKFSGSVSLIVAAYNEEKVIREKIKNCLKLDFGLVDAEIIIVSDGSTDSTNQILNDYSNVSKRLSIVTYHPRSGKAHALNVGASKAKGEILIFSDANVIIGAQSCCALLASFNDQHVGAVCGRVLVKPIGKQEVAGESIYMKFEGWIQRCEAIFNSMVGIDGAFFGLRSSLFKPLHPDTILDDFSLSMQAPLSGMRIVYESDALAVEHVIPSAENELKRKARIVTGGYQYFALMLKNRKALSAKMWFEFVSHKLLRWVAPLLMILFFITNILLLKGLFYQWLLSFQVIFYLTAFSGSLFKPLRKVRLVYLPYYFCVINYAVLVGCIRYVFFRPQVLWDKVER